MTNVANFAVVIDAMNTSSKLACTDGQLKDKAFPMPSIRAL